MTILTIVKLKAGSYNKTQWADTTTTIPKLNSMAIDPRNREEGMMSHEHKLHFLTFLVILYTILKLDIIERKI